MGKTRVFLFSLPLLGLVLCCSGDSDGPAVGSPSSYSNPPSYYSTMENLSVKVFYEPGAVPFTGNFSSGALAGRSYWTLSLENVKALFKDREKPVQVTVPSQLSEMVSISAQNRSGWTTQNILDLGNQLKTESTAKDGYLTVLFLKGYYESEGVLQKGVIGLNISGSPITAIFKDVVVSTAANPNGAVVKYVEQSSLVHELGHALGLVNNGVPMVAPHQDTEHGAHCSNQKCVMYYLNEGKSDLASFAQGVMASGNPVMFGSECLNDTKAYSPH